MKLSQKGFLHLHTLIAFVLVVGVIGGVGAYVITNSKAASALTSSTCYLRGRVWSTTANTCTKTCISDAGTAVVASPYDYCSGALSKISYATCDANGRKWLDVGCARRWQQTDKADAPQCKTAGQTYKVTSSIDKCVASTTTSTSSGSYAYSCTATFSSINSATGKITISGSVKNIGTATGPARINIGEPGVGVKDSFLSSNLAPGQTNNWSRSYTIKKGTVYAVLDGGTQSNSSCGERTY